MNPTHRVVMCRIAGVTFEGRQEKIARLHGNEPCRIEPEPDNPYDPNALKVMIASDEGPTHVGYVPRNLAAEIAPHLEGEALMITFNRVTGGFEMWDGGTANLGLVISITFPTDDGEL